MQQYAIVVRRQERDRLTVEDLAARANVHPDLVWQFVEFGLIIPVERDQRRLLFDGATAPRLRTIVRLRHSLGINLAGISVVLDLLEKLSAAQRENEALRKRG